MDVSKAIRSRRSIRAYDPREVEEEKLLRLLESGRLSPSAGNQPYIIGKHNRHFNIAGYEVIKLVEKCSLG